MGDGWAQVGRRYGALAGVGAAVVAMPGPFVARCPFHALTGLWCPACGTTRAAQHLLAVDPVAAVHAQPLLVLLPALLVAAMVRRRVRFGPTARRVAVRSVLFVLVLLTLARNVPSPAAGILAPPDARRTPTTQGGNP